MVVYRLHCTVWLSCYTVTELCSKLILPILLNCRLYALPQLKLPSHVCTPGCKLTTSINQLNCIVQRSDVCESQVSFKYCTVVQCQFIIQYSLFTTCYMYDKNYLESLKKYWQMCRIKFVLNCSAGPLHIITYCTWSLWDVSIQIRCIYSFQK